MFKDSGQYAKAIDIPEQTKATCWSIVSAASNHPAGQAPVAEHCVLSSCD